jgi:predicted dehydrogenase
MGKALSMTRLRLAVVGVGHLGKEHARILAGMTDVELIGVVDPRTAQAEAVAQRCGTRPFADHRPLLGAIDAAVVAAPTAYHHAVAIDFLRRGIPLLVEKPLAADLAQADELVALARHSGALLQVGHIERFNPAFEELQKRPLRPKYISAERCGGFSGRSTDVGVVLDLMIHDLDLLLALVGAPVRRVEALGVAVLGGHEDIAQARLTFADGCVADLRASRVHPTAVRSMQVWGAEGYAGVDFARRRLTLMQPAEHLNRRRLDVRQLDAAALASLKADLFGRHLQVRELDLDGPDQLTRELQHFVQCVRLRQRPKVDGTAGREALAVAGQILEAVRSHCWDGEVGGPCGPWQLPAPRGMLFLPPAQEAAA